MKYLCILILTLFTSTVFSQINLQWQKCFGGSLSEYPHGAIVNSQGGFTIVGATNSSDGQVTGLHGGTCWGLPCFDLWIVNTDSLGNILWTRTYGGTGGDGATSIAAMPKGGSIISCTSSSYDGDVTGNHGTMSTDAWIVKIDSLGDIDWQKCYGGSNGDGTSVIISTSDGGSIFCGQSLSIDGDVPGNHRPNPPVGSETTDAWVVKLDSLGNIQWSKNYGGIGDDVANDIVQAYDGGYLVLCSSLSGVNGDVSCFNGHKDYWLLKLDSFGNKLWDKCYGGSSIDIGHSIKQTLDSGFVMAGEAFSNDIDVSMNHDSGYGEIWVVKIDQFGNLEWEKSVGGTEVDRGYSIIVLEDSSYMVTGEVFSNDGDVTNNHGSFDLYVAKLTQSGQFEWGKCFGGGGDDAPRHLISAGTNEWLLLGYVESNNGDVSGNHGSEDIWAVKLNDSHVSVPEIVSVDDIKIFPNPFFSSISINFPSSLIGMFSIMNTLGKVLFEGAIKESEVINLSFLPDGVYFLTYSDKHIIKANKIIKMN